MKEGPSQLNKKPTLQDRSAVSWSLSNWARRASLGRRKYSPSMPLHCHGIGRGRVHSLHRSMIDKPVERTSRTSMKRNQSKWDPGRSRMGQGELCATSNGRRKCVRNDDSAVTFINIRWKKDNLYNSRAGAMEQSVVISHLEVKEFLDVPGGARN
jgi:hypothetical protein